MLMLAKSLSAAKKASQDARWMQAGKTGPRGLSKAYFESTNASFSDKSCQVGSAEAMALGTGSHSCHIHIHRQGRLPCQGLQNGPPALSRGQRHIQDLVQPSRPVTNGATFQQAC